MRLDLGMHRLGALWPHERIDLVSILVLVKNLVVVQLLLALIVADIERIWWSCTDDNALTGVVSSTCVEDR